MFKTVAELGLFVDWGKYFDHLVLIKALLSYDADNDALAFELS